MLLGIFSGMLANLPKAGAWTVRVKKGFGIAMLVIGAIFLWKSGAMLFAGGGKA
jgi:thiol:disulfide interchange protein